MPRARRGDARGGRTGHEPPAKQAALTRDNLKEFTAADRRERARQRGRSTPSPSPDFHEYQSGDSFVPPPPITAEMRRAADAASEVIRAWEAENFPPGLMDLALSNYPPEQGAALPAAHRNGSAGPEAERPDERSAENREEELGGVLEQLSNAEPATGGCPFAQEDEDGTAALVTRSGAMSQKRLDPSAAGDAGAETQADLEVCPSAEHRERSRRPPDGAADRGAGAVNNTADQTTEPEARRSHGETEAEEGALGENFEPKSDAEPLVGGSAHQDPEGPSAEGGNPWPALFHGHGAPEHDEPMYSFGGPGRLPHSNRLRTRPDIPRQQPPEGQSKPEPRLPSHFPAYYCTQNMNEVAAFLANASYVASLGGPPAADLKYGIIIVPAGEESLLFGRPPNFEVGQDFLDAIEDANRDYERALRMHDPDKDEEEFVRLRFDDDFPSVSSEAFRNVETTGHSQDQGRKGGREVMLQDPETQGMEEPRPKRQRRAKDIPESLSLAPNGVPSTQEVAPSRRPGRKAKPAAGTAPGNLQPQTVAAARRSLRVAGKTANSPPQPAEKRSRRRNG